jgi:hypothetical protein
MLYVLTRYLPGYSVRKLSAEERPPNLVYGEPDRTVDGKTSMRDHIFGSHRSSSPENGSNRLGGGQLLPVFCFCFCRLLSLVRLGLFGGFNRLCRLRQRNRFIYSLLQSLDDIHVGFESDSLLVRVKEHRIISCAACKRMALFQATLTNVHRKQGLPASSRRNTTSWKLIVLFPGIV